MPTYIFECKECGETFTEFAKMIELDTLKTVMYHCGQLMGTVIQAGGGFFSRSPFDTESLFEHCSPEPMRFKGKSEMKEYCEENGLISRYIEDGDIP